MWCCFCLGMRGVAGYLSHSDKDLYGTEDHKRAVSMS